MLPPAGEEEERASLGHLKEVLREDARLSASAAAAVRAAGRRRIAALLDPAMPPHPAFAQQRAFAEQHLRDTGFVTLDSDGRGRVLDQIGAKMPQFPAVPDAQDLGELYDRLQRYAAMRDRDAAAFPHPEVLGYRDEQPGLRAPRAAAPGKIKTLGDDKANLVRIGVLLDRLVPPTAYYNETRQDLIDYVMAEGKPVSLWAAQSRAMAADREVGGRNVFMPIGMEMEKNRVVGELTTLLAPAQAAFAYAAAPARMLTEEEACAIGRLVLPDHDAAAQTVLRRLRDVLPLERGKFTSQLKVLQMVSSRAEELLAPGGGFSVLETQSLRALAREPEVRALAAALQDYRLVRQGLQPPPHALPAAEIAARPGAARPDAAPAHAAGSGKRKREAAAPAAVKRLRQAGALREQTKLSFGPATREAPERDDRTRQRTPER